MRLINVENNKADAEMYLSYLLEGRIGMKKAISIYGDKEYIEHVGVEYVTFKFPDGIRDKLKTRKSELQQVCEWYKEEMMFYDRMYREISSLHDREKEKFINSHHYYDEEEINKACLKNRFADIDMKISNRNYLRDWNQIVGIHNTAMIMFDRYSKAANKCRQIAKVLNVM